MDIRALRYFIAVYEENSLSGAAKRCFVAQPSISSSLAQLESDLNTSLFVRHSKGVTPTDSGTRLYPHACKLVQDMQSMRSLFQPDAQPLEIAISLTPFLSGQLVSLVLKHILQDVPGIKLSLVDESEETDIRFTCNRYLSEDDAFHPLWEDHYVIAMPNDHPLSALSAITLKHLNNVAFISRTPCDVIESWEFLIQKAGVNIDVRAKVKTEEYALDLVAAGLGISLIPEHSARQRSDITLRPLQQIELKRIVGIAHRKQHSLPDILLNSIQATKHQIRELIQSQ